MEKIIKTSLIRNIMKVYLYTYAYDKIKQEGYKSLALFDKNSEHYQNALRTHRHSARSENIDEILAYLEQTFEGRLRSICVLTETAPVREYTPLFKLLSSPRRHYFI